MGRFQVLTAEYVGGKLVPQSLTDGTAVEHPTAFQAEWTARNIYSQGGCREWQVRDSKGKLIACYPTCEDWELPHPTEEEIAEQFAAAIARQARELMESTA